MKNGKSLISLADLSALEISQIISTAIKLKKNKAAKSLNSAKPRSVNMNVALQNKTLIMIFEKPSLRTRLSFEIGMTKLGGHAVYLAPQDIGLGVRESTADVARVASRMGDIIMARTFKHETVIELAYYASIPVINGLSDIEHPCQTLADLMTIVELKKKIEGLNIAFVGDGNNNVTHSLCLGAALFGANFICASPKKYTMNPAIVDQAADIAVSTGATIAATEYPEKAVYNADVVYTDTWVSMGAEDQKQTRLKTFAPFQVTEELMKHAKKNAIFMHDLPAYRGNEVTNEVIESSQSVVFQQAENRLWAQMALMLHLTENTATQA